MAAEYSPSASPRPTNGQRSLPSGSTLGVQENSRERSCATNYSTKDQDVDLCFARFKMISGKVVNVQIASRDPVESVTQRLCKLCDLSNPHAYDLAYHPIPQTLRASTLPNKSSPQSKKKSLKHRLQKPDHHIPSNYTQLADRPEAAGQAPQQWCHRRKEMQELDKKWAQHSASLSMTSATLMEPRSAFNEHGFDTAEHMLQLINKQELPEYPQSAAITERDLRVADFERCSKQFLSGAWPCDVKKATEIASLHAHITYGGGMTVSGSSSLPKNLAERLKELLPPDFRKDKTAMKLAKQNFMQFSSITVPDAQQLYTDLCKGLPTYEATFFAVKAPCKKNKRAVVPCILAISPTCIVRLDSSTMEVVSKWSLSDVENSLASPTLFGLKFKHYEELTVMTFQAEQIQSVLNVCAEEWKHRSQAAAGYIDVTATVADARCVPYSTRFVRTDSPQSASVDRALAGDSGVYAEVQPVHAAASDIAAHRASVGSESSSSFSAALSRARGTAADDDVRRPSSKDSNASLVSGAMSPGLVPSERIVYEISVEIDAYDPYTSVYHSANQHQRLINEYDYIAVNNADTNTTCADTMQPATSNEVMTSSTCDDVEAETPSAFPEDADGYLASTDWISRPLLGNSAEDALAPVARQRMRPMTSSVSRRMATVFANRASSTCRTSAEVDLQDLCLSICNPTAECADDPDPTPAPGSTSTHGHQQQSATAVSCMDKPTSSSSVSFAETAATSKAASSTSSTAAFPASGPESSFPSHIYFELSPFLPSQLGAIDNPECLVELTANQHAASEVYCESAHRALLSSHEHQSPAASSSAAA
eukprot:scpid44889/ scgid1859/ Talin-1